ncbi:MAG: hypothetical protein HYV96_19065 [Opitutae bacterium]|nr:hypothetical protein [Opitutae bacterium]
MNHDPLHDLWCSPANQPDSSAGRAAAAQFAAQWRRRRRWQAAWLAWTFLALTAATALAVTQVLRGTVDLGPRAALVPLLGLPWLAAFYFLRRHLRQGAAAPHAGEPFGEALRHAEQANAAERHRLTVIGWLLVAMTPVSALAVFQLHAAGKASAHEAWSMAAVFGVALAAGLCAVVLRLRRRLQPERRLIEARLRELVSSAST